MNQQIKQIIPADHWYANGASMPKPLVGWALLSDGAVVGLVVVNGAVVAATSMPDFKGYRKS